MNKLGSDGEWSAATCQSNTQKNSLGDQKCDHGHGRAILQRHVSLERLNPDYGCSTRKSSIAVAITNLIATTTGGGVLSLPLAFRRAGILPTTFLMIYGFLATDFSLYVLVSCARRTGGRSYGDVASAAFGNLAEVATTSLIGFMLIGSLTAYLVLVKDTWTPVVLLLLPLDVKGPLLSHQHDAGRTGSLLDPTLQASKQGSSLVLLIIVIVSAPLLLKRDLHALRFTCYLGFSSCVLLMVAVVYRAYQAMQIPGRAPLRWYSTDIADYAFAFPIVVLCFFCSYNVLSVHSSLVHPTRERLKFVLDTSMILCML
jgi:sodium-coupled neutral amino acid transporter 11